MKSKPKKQTADTEILRRLAQGFAAIAWGSDRILCPSDAATLLDINEEDAILLCGCGFLRGCERGGGLGIPLAEVIRFHEQHGSWWFTTRARKQLERLREMTAAKEARERAAVSRLTVAA